MSDKMGVLISVLTAVGIIGVGFLVFYAVANAIVINDCGSPCRYDSDEGVCVDVCQKVTLWNDIVRKF